MPRPSPRPRLEAIKGHRYGKWTVLETGLRTPPSPSQRVSGGPGTRAARCQCSCGEVRLVKLSDLVNGAPQACSGRHSPGRNPVAPKAATTATGLDLVADVARYCQAPESLRLAYLFRVLASESAADSDINSVVEAAAVARRVARVQLGQLLEPFDELDRVYDELTTGRGAALPGTSGQ